MRPLNDPIKRTGHIQVLKGNLAPAGAVAKITGKEGLQFSGPAKVYDSEEQMLAALEQTAIEKGDVIVIRYEGPKGGPGMPEMLTPTSAVMGAGLGKDVALITDGPVFRRVAWIHRRAHHAGSPGWRAGCANSER